MINFFRKIRRKFADNNQFFKYSRYAIGEIVLVVIGILIALSINNWNEQRKNERKLMNIFIEIQDDLSKDILRLDEILIWYKKKHSLIYLVLNDSLTIQDYEDNPNLTNLISSEEFYIHANGFNDLMNHMDFIKPSHKHVVDKLKHLYVERKDLIEKINEDVFDEVFKNVRYLQENKKWTYKMDKGLTAEMMEYYVNDPFYKNRVYYFETLVEHFYFLEYRNKASKIYSDLSKIIGRKMELPIHIINSIHYPDSLKNYIGRYKQLDRDPPVYYTIRTDQHDISVNRLNIYQIARDTFGLRNPNFITTFKRNNSGEIIGLKTVYFEESLEFEKIE